MRHHVLALEKLMVCFWMQIGALKKAIKEEEHRHRLMTRDTVYEVSGQTTPRKTV